MGLHDGTFNIKIKGDRVALKGKAKTYDYSIADILAAQRGTSDYGSKQNWYDSMARGEQGYLDKFGSKYPTSGMSMDDWYNKYFGVMNVKDSKAKPYAIISLMGGNGAADNAANAESAVKGQELRDAQSGTLRKVTKFVVPAAIAAGATFLGGAALAPAMAGAGAGAGAAASGAAGTGAAAGTTTGLSSGALSLGGIGASGGTLSAASGAGGLGSSFLGGLGTFAKDAAINGAVRGGIGGFASTGDLSGAIKGAGLGGLTGGYGGAASNALGLSGAGAAAFQKGITGASGSLANGDIKGAAMAGGLSAAGGYVGAGGKVPGLGSWIGASLDQTTGSAGMQGATQQGTGILGTLSKAANTVQRGVGMLSGNGGGNFGLGSALKLGSGLYSGYSNNKAMDEIEEQLLAGQGRAEDALNPYNKAGLGATNQLAASLAAGYQPGDLTQDPGYQFRLQEGQKSLERSLGARGMQNSGAAMKAAQEYGQGLADQTYNDGYSRWLQQNQQLAGLSGQGQEAASSLGNIYQTAGLTRANATNAKAENRNKTIADILAQFQGGGLGGLGSLFN